MSGEQIKRLLQSRAARKGFKLGVEVLPWPFAGTLQRLGDSISILIDSRRSAGDQLHALAHEAGHLLFGHYELENEVWTLQEGPGGDEWEWEADLFAAFATRTPGTPPGWFLEEQLKLRLGGK